MKLKELCLNWPPDVAVSTQRLGAIKPDLDDTITSAFKYPGVRHHITLNLRKADGAEYGVILILPTQLLDTAIVLITQNLTLTLREVGELLIS